MGTLTFTKMSRSPEPETPKGLYELAFYACVPGWAFKQVVNVVQMYGAMEELAALGDTSK